MNLVEHLNKIDLDTCIKREPIVYKHKPQIYGNWEVISDKPEYRFSKKGKYGKIHYKVLCIGCRKTTKTLPKFLLKSRTSKVCIDCRFKDRLHEMEIVGKILVLFILNYKGESIIHCFNCHVTSLMKTNTLITRKKQSQKESCFQCTNSKIFYEDRVYATLKHQFDQCQKDTRRVRKPERSVWELDFKTFKKLVYDSCFYCGIIGIRNVKDKHSDTRIRINGIDRIDNSKGYLKNNVVTSCFQCNQSKRHLSLDEFREWAKRLCQNMGNW